MKLGTAIGASALAMLAVALHGDPVEARHGCASEARDVVVRTSEAIVFRKGTFEFGETRQPLFFGCAFRRGTIHRLNGRDSIGFKPLNRDTIAVSGHFVAFAQVPNTAGGDGADEFVVENLRTGTRRFISTDDNETTAAVIRRDGAATRIATGPSLPQRDRTEQVVETLATDGRVKTLDRGADIAPRSLALSADRATVFWTNAGQARSAPSG